MGRPFIDHAGDVFGRLTVLSRAENKGRHAAWNCLCSCGNYVVVPGGSLRNGGTKSCGCLNSELSKDRHLTHGMSKTREFKIWSAMIERCHNKNNRAYLHYGGRGIFVCDKWRNSFNQFYSDMGSRPSLKHSIERIDNNLGYSADNCHWATYVEQANNKRNNVRIEYDGENLTLAQWAAIINVSANTLYTRHHRGWDAKRILTTPPNEPTTGHF